MSHSWLESLEEYIEGIIEVQGLDPKVAWLLVADMGKDNAQMVKYERGQGHGKGE